MTKIFSEFVVNFDSIIINLSPRFYICSECDAQFSSISRFLAHTQKNCFKNFTCKHCEKTFASHNKLHKHVRLRHDKKMSDKTLRQRFLERKDSYINLSTSYSISSTTFESMTASAKSSYLFISMTKAQVARFIESSVDFSITSMNLTASTASIVSAVSTRFFYSTKSLIAFESTSTILKLSHHSITMINASIVCSFTSSLTSSRSSIVSHQKSFTLKFYMTMKKLFEMFAEKSSKRNMNIIQKKSIFSCFHESRQTRIKSLR